MQHNITSAVSASNNRRIHSPTVIIVTLVPSIIAAIVSFCHMAERVASAWVMERGRPRPPTCMALSSGIPLGVCVICIVVTKGCASVTRGVLICDVAIIGVIANNCTNIIRQMFPRSSCMCASANKPFSSFMQSGANRCTVPFRMTRRLLVSFAVDNILPAGANRRTVPRNNTQSPFPRQKWNVAECIQRSFTSHRVIKQPFPRLAIIKMLRMRGQCRPGKQKQP
jgi:hypothetical protein